MITIEKPTDEIFHLSLDELVKMSSPEHEGQHPLFKKFGTRTGGFCDTWLFNKGWEHLSDVEKWQYVALCSLYWLQWYEYWHNQKEIKLEIERMYKALEKHKDNEREKSFIEQYINELKSHLS